MVIVSGDDEKLWIVVLGRAPQTFVVRRPLMYDSIAVITVPSSDDKHDMITWPARMWRNDTFLLMDYVIQRTDGRTGLTDGGTDGGTDGRTGLTDGGTDGRTDGLTDGRTDGLGNGQTSRQADRHTLRYVITETISD